MKIRCTLFIYLFFGLIGFENYAYEIKPVKSIGSDKDNYIFFRITDAIIDSDKCIYVCDSGSFSISKYNWSGKFIKRVGKFGQGPKDFAALSDIEIYDNNIYIWDIRNSRISVLNNDLTPKKYIKLNFQFWDMKILKEDSFLCTFSSSLTKKRGQILIIDDKGKIIRDFFFKNQLGKLTYPKNELQYAFTLPFSRTEMDFSSKKGELLIGFQFTNNPAVLYLYDIFGNMRKKIKVTFDKKYKFHFGKMTMEKLRKISSAKSNIYFPLISSVFIYGNRYLVFINFKVLKNSKESLIKNLCYILNEEGEVLERIKIEGSKKFFNITDDGYLIGTDSDVDTPRILIYKLNL